jgi:hypothetical protein
VGFSRVDILRPVRTAAVVLVLAVIAAGASVVYRGVMAAQGDVARTVTGGTLLCGLSLALLFGLGRRVEK